MLSPQERRDSMVPGLKGNWYVLLRPMQHRLLPLVNA